MFGLIAAVSFSVCTNCVGTGSITVNCPDCSGKGLVSAPTKTKTNRQNMVRGVFSSGLVACRKCTRGLITTGSKGTGKISRTCPTCKGQKKIKGS